MSWFSNLFSTKRARQKQLARNIFAGARLGRLTSDWIAPSLSADRELQSGNLLVVRARARELDRNNPVVTSYKSLITANVVGPDGIRPNVQVLNPDGSLSKKECDALQAAYLDWCEAVSVCGRLNMTDFAKLALKSAAIDGESLIQKVNLPLSHNKWGFGVQLVDADLLDHEYNRPAGTSPRGEHVNEVRLGVEIDAFSRPVAYHVWTHHASDFNVAKRSRKRISADELIHFYDYNRANQSRGVSWLNPVMLAIKMLEGYQDSELVSARISSAKMGFLEYTESAAAELSHAIPTEEMTFSAEPGSLQHLPPGLSFREWNPQHPGNTYDPFVKSKLREIASGLRVSYHSLTADLSGVNYSSLRSGLLLERDQYRALQKLMIAKVYQPVYEAWLANAVLSPAWPAELRRDFDRYVKAVQWIPRGWDWVDPLKDMNAHLLALNAGLTSRTQVLAERGGDYESVLAEIAREQQLREQLGVSAPGGQQPLVADDDDSA